MKLLKKCFVLGLCLVLTGCSSKVNDKSDNDYSIYVTEKDTSKRVENTTGKEIITEEITTEEISTEEKTTEEKKPEVLTDEQRAAEMVKDMTLEEKVGQMFIARCPQSNAAKLVEKYKVGGYILFADDFKEKTKEQVIINISSYQDASKIPMFIGVDEEGGTVVRVSRFTQFRSERFKSPQKLYAQGGMELIASDAREKSRFLKGFGINLNFAPVADVSTDANDFIYDRTFGKDANETAKYVRSVVEVMNEERMGSVLKHFPGYGNNEDTHIGIAYDNRSYDSFVSSDFVPFEAGIDEGVGMVMVAHNIVYSMDGEYPASLSAKVHKILRDELGFDGVIITDDLSMDGITQYTGDSEAAVLAVKAGNDLLCCTNFEEQIPAVIEAVRNGEILEEQINESVIRILKLKMKLGIS